MATYRKREDEMVSCPYNPAHRMLQSRLQLHLTKCKKYHLDADMKTCPFNAKHRVNSAEFSHHMVVCPDRGIVERKIALETSEFKGRSQVPSYTSKIATLPAAENEYWDDECYEDAHTERQKKVSPIYTDMINIQDMKPAERRSYYQSLTKRLTEREEAVKKEEQAAQEAQNAVPVLRELRQPRSKPVDVETSRNNYKMNQLESSNLPNLSLGRGSSSRRIAANIFGQAANDPSCYSTNYLIGNMTNLSLGRGRGVLGAVKEAPGTVDEYPPIPHGQVNNM